jgi:hypothetical protein
MTGSNTVALVIMAGLLLIEGLVLAGSGSYLSTQEIGALMAVNSFVMILLLIFVPSGGKSKEK